MSVLLMDHPSCENYPDNAMVTQVRYFAAIASTSSFHLGSSSWQQTTVSEGDGRQGISHAVERSLHRSVGPPDRSAATPGPDSHIRPSAEVHAPRCSPGRMLAPAPSGFSVTRRPT